MDRSLEMATWITVSASDVRITSAELAAVNAASPQQTLQQCVDAAANFARGYIGKRNSMADPPQIPPECKEAVLALALADFVSQIPGAGLLDDVRKTARDNAIKFFKDIATGNFVITAADVEEAVQPVTPSPNITVPTQQFQPSTNDLDGF